MAVVTTQQVQAWLEQTKLSISSFDSDLELVARTTAYAMLSEQYDTSTWTNVGSTPVLVQEVIAMLVAAWTYQRQYSEDSTTENWYASWLESKAMALLTSIVTGVATLTDSPQINKASTPTFFPDDNATSIALDQAPDADGAANLAFTMGVKF